MKINKKLLKYFEVIKISRNELFASPYNFLARLLIHALRISVFGIIYTNVFNSIENQDIGGFTSIDAIWSLAFVQMIYQCSMNVLGKTRDEILTGQIETKLNKPYSFIVLSFLEAWGQVPVKFTGFSVVTIFVLTVFFGVPSFSWIQIIFVLIMFVLGMILHTLNQQLIALSAFWIENPDPIFWITNKFAWIVNGTFVPLALLPILFRQISDLFPLSAPFFVGRIHEMSTLMSLLKHSGIQIIWILVVIIAIRFIYRRGITKISINGG